MPEYTTVRVRIETRESLRSLAEASGQSMAAVLEEAVERLRRDRFLREVAAAYSVERSAPDTASSLDAEIHAWDATLLDGLAPEPIADGEAEAEAGARPAAPTSDEHTYPPPQDEQDRSRS